MMEWKNNNNKKDKKKQQAWQESKERVNNSNGDLCYSSVGQHSLVFFDLHMTL